MLTNTKDNDAGDIIFSQRSSARPTPNSDIDFDYTVLEEADGDGSSSSCEISTKISVTVDKIPTLRPNRRVSLVGTISLGSETPMEIKLRRSESEKLALVKDDCVVEDETDEDVAYMRFVYRTSI